MSHTNRPYKSGCRYRRYCRFPRISSSFLFSVSIIAFSWCRFSKEASLKEAIVKTFGEDQRFYTCSAENMDADELIVFLKQKGKFMPVENGFTVDITKVCNH